MPDELTIEPRLRPGGPVQGGGSQRQVRYWGFVINGARLDDVVADHSGQRGDFVQRLGHGKPKWREEGVAEFLGASTTERPGGRAPVLICGECGDLGCGSITVQIHVEPDRVVWCDFAYENGYEPAHPYDGIGPYSFPRHDYEETVLASRVDPDGD